MIRVVCDTREEFRKIHYIIEQGCLNAVEIDMNALKIDANRNIPITYNIRENKKKWYQKFKRKVAQS